MSFVYIISEGEQGPVKIGAAKSPDCRLVELQTGNPRRLRLVDTFLLDSRQDAFDVERTIREALHEERLIGEWFAITEAEALTIVPVYVSDLFDAEKAAA